MPETNDLLLHSEQPERAGAVIDVTPEQAGWEYVGLRVQLIEPGGFWNYASEQDELCIVPLRGSAVIESGDESWKVSRPGTMFDGKPTALYLPVGSSVRATSEEGAELAITTSRASRHFPPKLIEPDDGFGLQRLYTADGSFDQAWVIHDGDLLLVPEGYHAFAIAHGYTGYYLNILAGDEAERTMQPADDPRYAWVRATWDDLTHEHVGGWQDIDKRVNAGAGRRDRGAHA